MRDKKLKRRVLEEGLHAYLDDTAEAWTLQADGSYRAPKPKSAGISAQRKLIADLAAESEDE